MKPNFETILIHCSSKYIFLVFQFFTILQVQIVAYWRYEPDTQLDYINLQSTTYSYQVVFYFMPQRTVVLKGDRFGILSILEEESTRKYRRIFSCLCDCGNTTSVELNNLKNGHTKSCGCLRVTLTTFTHRMSKSKEYKSYRKMIERCTREKDISYKICFYWVNEKTRR